MILNKGTRIDAMKIMIAMPKLSLFANAIIPDMMVSGVVLPVLVNVLIGKKLAGIIMNAAVINKAHVFWILRGIRK